MFEIYDGRIHREIYYDRRSENVEVYVEMIPKQVISGHGYWKKPAF